MALANLSGFNCLQIPTCSCAQQMRYPSSASHNPTASITLIFILERMFWAAWGP